MAHWLPNERDTFVVNDLRDGKFVAVVKSGAGENKYILEMRNRFAAGEELEILSPYSFGKTAIIESIADLDGNGKSESILPCEQVIVSCDAILRAGDILRRKTE